VPIKHIKLFSIVNNIEMLPYKGAVLCRSAGVSAILIGKTLNRAMLKLNSG
jgi:ribosomal protein L2